MNNKFNLKNIKNLTKLFIKDSTNKIDIIKDNKINKKSIWFWIIIILVIGIIQFSSKLIDFFEKRGQPEIFLNGYFLFLMILLIIEAIMITVNIFYFSKDLENILPMPFKPIEILISKFITVLSFLYGTLIIFAFIPLNIYGVTVDIGLMYFVNVVLCLIIFPIFPAVFIVIITMLLMNLFEKLKNKNLIQIGLTFFLIFILIFGLYFIFNNSKNNYSDLENINPIELKIKNINNYFIILKPIINILEKNNLFKNLIYYFYLILINLFLFFIFIFIGKKLYLKQILKMSFFEKNKKIKIINLNKKIKKNKIYKSYIKKEIKNIIKNPLFFIKCIYPILINTFVVSLILAIVIPQVKEVAYEQNLTPSVEFSIRDIFYIIGGIQIIGLFNKTTITAISREGSNAYILKFLPIDLYRQFVYKNIPQIFMNTISSTIILSILYFNIDVLNLKYIILLFFINFILYCINSYLLLIINLLIPKNKWNSEHEIFKNNKNFLIQYLIIIFDMIFLYYFNKLFYNYNLDKSINLFLIILIIIFIILNILVNKFKNKLFEKIN